MNTYSYMEKYVVFIDILGFRETINKLEDKDKKQEQEQERNDEELQIKNEELENGEKEKLLRNLIDALTNLTQIKEFFDEQYPANSTSESTSVGIWDRQIMNNWFKPNIQVFSDNIYISINNNPLALKKLGAYVCLIYNTLFSYGLFARGSITIGKVFESNNAVFGKGLIEAYDLESKTAIYPRVLISDSIVAEIKNIPDFYYDKDFDGNYYVDVFFPGVQQLLENWHKKTNFGETLLAGREQLITEYKNAKNQRIKSKLYWLINYFNKKSGNHGLPLIDSI